MPTLTPRPYLPKFLDIIYFFEVIENGEVIDKDSNANN